VSRSCETSGVVEKSGAGAGAAEPIAEVVAVLREVLAISTGGDQDVDWSSWSSTEQMNAELTAHMALLEHGDRSGLADLYVLFLPTGALGEVAISSGWVEQYVRLAERFDRAYLQLTANGAGGAGWS
jgi:hypothetical protein